MNNVRSSFLVPTLWALLASLVSACSNDPAPLGPQNGPPGKGGGLLDTALALEATLADADTGLTTPLLRGKLESFVKDEHLTNVQKGHVRLALARIILSTDRERAIALLEESVSFGDRDAERALFRALADRDAPTKASRRVESFNIAESATLFAKYFPTPMPDRRLDVERITIGAISSPTLDSLGAFAIDAALRQSALEQCGLKEDCRIDVHLDAPSEATWAALPRYADRIDQALVVVYVNADTIPPPRYEHYLAASVADIMAAIADNDGLIAIKERPHAPPLVTLVAPRPAQLVPVETRLASMDKIPKAPVRVPMTGRLEPSEIQRVVRLSFDRFRPCYETLLTSRPGATGTLELAFTIGHDGVPRDLKAKLSGSLEEPSYRKCAERVANDLRFPAFSNNPKDIVTVVYPIVLSP